jgi:hypothetical protein
VSVLAVEGRTVKKESEATILMWKHLCELDMVRSKEFQFFPGRKWRFDFAISSWDGEKKDIAIEIEGGAFTQGRHTRGVGFVNDLEKYNHAALQGWRLLRFTPRQVLDGTAIAFIKRVLES